MFTSSYLSNKPIRRAMRDFGQLFSPDDQVLDIGCGHKPYRKFFHCEYVGVDTFAQVSPDIIAEAWNIPVPDSSFDGVILNQSLEHIAQTDATIREVYRILKPGGRLIVTAPQTYKNHSGARPIATAPVPADHLPDEPYWRVDYYRFTRYGLLYLFQSFKVTSLRETTGYIGTLCHLVNSLFASLNIDPLPVPLYSVMNIGGLAADTIARRLSELPVPLFNKFYLYSYTTLTINYILVAEKPASAKSS